MTTYLIVSMHRARAGVRFVFNGLLSMDGQAMTLCWENKFGTETRIDWVSVSVGK